MTLEVLLVVGLAAVAVAALSGWSDLSERFRYRSKFRGKMYRFRQYGTSRWLMFGDLDGIGTLNVGISEKGLFQASGTMSVALALRKSARRGDG
jgi:hypothetical protein